jgi:hypothetical protein
MKRNALSRINGFSHESRRKARELTRKEYYQTASQLAGGGICE